MTVQAIHVRSACLMDAVESRRMPIKGVEMEDTRLVRSAPFARSNSTVFRLPVCAATANAVKASAHVNNIVEALDNPTTLNELRQTAYNASQLTAKINAVGGDVEKLTSDPEFMKGLRNVTIGLGELFSEIYPANTDQ